MLVLSCVRFFDTRLQQRVDCVLDVASALLAAKHGHRHEHIVCAAAMLLHWMWRL